VTKYSKLEDRVYLESGSAAWKSCIRCAGGASHRASLATSAFNTSPSKDGASRDFYINGEAYSSGLWYHKIGPKNSAKNFKFEFWVNAAANTQAANAMEFDAFQFVNGRQYMFGTQCNYAAHVWDVWNSKNSDWHHTSIPCTKFTPHVWYHIIMTFHRTDHDHYEHYDQLTIVKHDSSGKVTATNTYDFNRDYPAGSESGWDDNIGVQFQMDIGAHGAEMQEWVDQVSLTTW
jgi:hypothetical protein